MIYKIIFEVNIEKTLKRLPQKDTETILEKIERLSNDPRPRWIEKLKTRSCYRLACGNYRILYTVDDKKLTVYVVDIADRKNVYRKK